jgi:hypothetical protein
LIYVFLFPIALVVIVAVIWMVMGRGNKEMLGVEEESTQTAHKHRKAHHGAAHRRDKHN